MSKTIDQIDKPYYTYGDYIFWREDWELIQGYPYSMSPSPTFKHQRTCLKIASQLDELLKASDKCQVNQSVDWIISDDIIVKPDVFVSCEPVKDLYLTAPPIIVFEVLSEKTKMKDQTLKYTLYQNYGVKYYIMVDLTEKKANIHQLTGQKYQKMFEVDKDIVPFDLGECEIKFNFALIEMI